VYGAPYARRDREGSAARQGGERGATGRGARRDREGSAARHLMARALRGGILSVRAGVQACVCVRACRGRAGAPERIKKLKTLKTKNWKSSKLQNWKHSKLKTGNLQSFKIENTQN